MSKASCVYSCCLSPTSFQFALSLQALLLLGSPTNGGAEGGRPAALPVLLELEGCCFFLSSWLRPVPR